MGRSSTVDGAIDDLESARRRAGYCGTGVCKGTGAREGPMAALSERIRLLEEELLEMNEAGNSLTWKV